MLVTVHPLATDGNDVVVSVGGLDAGRTVATGGGNDVVSITGGPMKGLIDAGAGNDVVIVAQLDGEVRTGAGHDSIVVNGFAPLDLSGPQSLETVNNLLNRLRIVERKSDRHLGSRNNVDHCPVPVENLKHGAHEAIVPTHACRRYPENRNVLFVSDRFYLVGRLARMSNDHRADLVRLKRVAHADRDGAVHRGLYRLRMQHFRTEIG
jgi:hypothetical protein